MRKNTILALWCIGIAVTIFLLQHRARPQYGDPDRYYHYAVSRYMNETPGLFPKVFPQVKGLGWDEYFPDKEFLYHQVTALGYRLGGETGVIYIAIACGISLTLLYFLYGASLLPPWIVASSLLLSLLSPTIFYRIVMVRPHVLAMFAFLALMISVIERRKYWALAAAALFTLSYHAFYVPLICLALAGALGAWQEGPARRRTLETAGCGLAGLLLGLLLNPYFPSNIIGSIEIARIPFLMENEMAGVPFGEELYALPTNTFLRFMFFQSLALVAGIFFLGRKQWKELREADAFPLAYLVLAGGFTLVLSLLSRRGSEYFVPLAGLLILTLLARVKTWDWKASAAWGAVTVVAVGYFADLYRGAIALAPNDRFERSARALAAVPPGPATIYNCEWDFSPYVIYQRPDLSVIDILDPSLLYFHNHEAFKARNELRKSLVGDPRGLILNAFKSDYALCSNGPLIEQMQNDPGFQQLYPRANSETQKDLAGPYLFRLEKNAIPQYVKDYSLRWFAPRLIKDFRSLRLADAEAAARPLTLEKTAYLNLSSAFVDRMSDSMKDKDADSHLFCASASPTPEEIRRLAGANFVVLGGGRNLQLWRNGVLVFDSIHAYANPVNSRVVVPLDVPLAAGDRIDAVACSLVKANYWGVALSFWTQKELAQRCAWKSAVAGNTWGEAYPQDRRVGPAPLTCLGELASRPLPSTYRAIRLAP